MLKQGKETKAKTFKMECVVKQVKVYANKVVCAVEPISKYRVRIDGMNIPIAFCAEGTDENILQVSNDFLENVEILDKKVTFAINAGTKTITLMLSGKNKLANHKLGEQKPTDHV